MREEAAGLGLRTPVDWRGEVTAAAETWLARLSVLADLVFNNLYNINIYKIILI